MSALPPFTLEPAPVIEELLPWRVWKQDGGGSSILAGFAKKSDAKAYIKCLESSCHGWLASLQTRITRYKAEDGKERMVLLADDAAVLLERVKAT